MSFTITARPDSPAARRPLGGTLALAMALAMTLMGTDSAHALSARAHPEATLEGDRTNVEVGGVIGLHGSKFEENESYTLQLLGALNEYDLGTATADGEGVFQLDMGIPYDVRPGAYQIVAIAPDGDVSARFDVTISEASAADETATPADGSAASGSDMAGMDDHQATTDEIRIERNRGGIEWAGIGLIIGVAGGLGLGLRLRQPAV